MMNKLRLFTVLLGMAVVEAALALHGVSNKSNKSNNASASKAQGSGNGSEVTYTNTQAAIDQNKNSFQTGGELFNNGIMNTEQDALANAAKQSTPAANQQGVYVIINPHTGNPVAEVLTAAWDKLNEITNAGLPISNAAQANIDLRTEVKAQGGLVAEVDHSRGSLTGSVATSEQVNRGVSDAAIGTVTFNGAAANSQRMADQVNTATGGTGVVQQATHKDDLIGTLVGGNAATGGRDASLMDAHTTYTGSLPPVTLQNEEKNQLRKETNQIWGEGQYSKPVVVSPSN